MLADAIDRHGSTPVVVKTARGRFQAWYQHDGERRQIRPSPDLPIDVLGAGLVVCPPSVAGRSRYEIIQGSLDDLDCLPAMRRGNNGGPSEGIDGAGVVLQGRRNKTLLTFCGRNARRCSSLDELLSLARDEACSYLPPMDDAEIVKTARQVWRYLEQGRLRIGTHGAWFEADAAMALAKDPPLFALLAFLQATNGPNAQFWIADGLVRLLRWSRREFSGARRRAIAGAWVRRIRGHAPGRPALYEWGRPPFRAPE